MNSLALNYHENTKFFSGSQPFDPKIQYKIYPNTKTIPLGKNSLNIEQQDGDSFLQTLLSRKSTRAFTPENIDLSTLGQLLTLSCGLKNDNSGFPFRTYASAGALYPIEVYAVILRSDDIQQGIYHYNVKDNTLELLRAGDYSETMNSFYRNQINGIITSDFPCILLFSMVFDRSMEKYGERGYRFMLIDAGHMSQNLYLVATYLGLGIVALGAGS